ncbi:DUF1413 domain-containing protein [Ureibacillus sp. Re31]|uniref:DUF1413 domain-containing protein n=1 Tax=Ureibacillus galli TaxID=2762222 RepID=A0ABR8XAJ3_9BACL|nr:DUF1413 domain-containing protein [Ureibacillus galli]MBD8026335.1 DUF1413 domain-containing protein [Ureibacillus galli]
MSQTVTIRFSDEEYDYLEDVAKEAEQSIGAVIKDLVLHELGYETTGVKVSILAIHEKAKHLPPGTEFKIRDLFSKIEWNQFTKSSRISAGREFLKKVKTDLYLSGEYSFVRKDSDNAAIYRKQNSEELDWD